MARYYLWVMIGVGLIVMMTTACNASDGDADERSNQDMATEDEVGDGMTGMNMAEIPDDLDLAAAKNSEDGRFQVTISSELDPLEINQIHSWLLHVETSDGEPVEGAEILVEGGMPQHNHGFPTVPEVTEDLGKGDYRLDGVKFNMAGWWEITLTIQANGQSDSVTFNIAVPQ